MSAKPIKAKDVAPMILQIMDDVVWECSEEERAELKAFLLESLSKQMFYGTFTEEKNT